MFHVSLPLVLPDLPFLMFVFSLKRTLSTPRKNKAKPKLQNHHSIMYTHKQNIAMAAQLYLIRNPVLKCG